MRLLKGFKNMNIIRVQNVFKAITEFNAHFLNCKLACVNYSSKYYIRKYVRDIHNVSNVYFTSYYDENNELIKIKSKINDGTYSWGILLNYEANDEKELKIPFSWIEN